MPTPFNVTIDDVSPLIAYDPPGYWTQNSSVDAYGGSYTSTFYPNASASFEFDGTSIIVTGSKGSWHGTYSVSLDGYIKAFNGSAKSDSFKAIIFSSGTLMEGHHSLQIMNTDPTWLNLDIDSITWTCVLGNDSVSTSPLQSTTVDDSDPAFSYLPHGGWDLNPSNIASFSNKTGHSISLPQASVNFTFSSTGDAVSIYGTTGPGNSPYSIQRAGEPPKELSATRTMNSSQVLLYFGSDFGPGNHTVTMVNEAHGLFQIDYAVVHAVDFSSLPSSSTPTPSTPSPTIVVEPSPSTHSTLPAGAIAGISVGALLFVFLGITIWFLLRRNKTLWMRLQRGYMVQSQFDVTTPPTGTVTPLPYSQRLVAQTARTKGAYFSANTDDSFDTPPLVRAVTMQSTASTLVAVDGSNMTEVAGHRGLALKPLRLASRLASGSPSSTHLTRSPSTRHLLREESQYYDPDAAAMSRIEGSEDRVDDVLRHPIRRNAPSTHQWQSALP